MDTVVIPTARLKLVLQTPDEVLAWVASLPLVDRAEVSPAWIARVRSTPAGDPWALSYRVVERATGAAVGGCAFKGPPDAFAVVELAYGIDLPHRGRGFATEVAGALTGFALASGRVRMVRAHTKLDNPASARVLEKCGFRRVGEVIDPEDGPVCRWERGPAESAAAP
ncbi:MAG TPA: GNAT family N-acetyltransferase [Gemmataceae bacterium]|nr:GNAT family N-acetyltransferase [Gemmataceae bacterium]